MKKYTNHYDDFFERLSEKYNNDNLYNIKRRLLIIISIVIFIGIIVCIFLSVYLPNKNVKQKTNKTVEYSNSNEDDTSNKYSNIKNLYDYFEMSNNIYLSDNKLTEEEKDELTDKLDKLIQSLIEDNVNDTTNILSDLSDFNSDIDEKSSYTDTITNLSYIYIKELSKIKNNIIGYYDKLYNDEFIAYSEQEEFEKDLKFLKKLVEDLSNIQSY